MRIKKLLWVLALLLLLWIVSSRRDTDKEEMLEGYYENCYMLSLKEEQMTVLVGDKQWILSCPVGKETEKMDKIVDITVEKNAVKKITWKEGCLEDQVESIVPEEGWMRLNQRGKVTISPTVQCYIKSQNQVRLMKNMGSLLNWDKVQVYMQENQVDAIVADGEENMDIIKVLLHGTEEEIYHKEVRITATADYEVAEEKGKKHLAAGQEYRVQAKEGICHITSETGKIRILSMKHSAGNPEYRGKITVTAAEKGYLLVNELPLEEYLYSVVSSEMPSSYPSEALKAQAICARTYAFYQMRQAYYSAYGAHVDDTVNSQVYNNVPETKESIEAVTETKGQYIVYNKEPIPAYFYSTSCGSTSDVNDVWIKEDESPMYLQGHFQGEDEKGIKEFEKKENSQKESKLIQVDLSSEKAFRNFLQAEINCYEKEEDWFRWQTTIKMEDLSKHINANVKDGNIGTVKEVKVQERSKGGVIKKIKITGKEGNLIVIGEYQIRKVLCPANSSISLKNGSTRKLSMLPSGYFTVKKEKNKITLSGGGYGHGVGLSQNGAKAMAECSNTCKEILEFYYPGTELWEEY